MCVYIYVRMYTLMRQITPSAGLSSSFSILSHTFRLLLVVAVDCLAFPNSSAVTRTLTGGAAQPAGLALILFLKIALFRIPF